MNFEIKNYRSFGEKTKFELKKYNLFAGANNCGKSNLANFLKTLKYFTNPVYLKNLNQEFNNYTNEPIVFNVELDSHLSVKYTIKPHIGKLMNGDEVIQTFISEIQLKINEKNVVRIVENGNPFVAIDCLTELSKSNFITFCNYLISNKEVLIEKRQGIENYKNSVSALEHLLDSKSELNGDLIFGKAELGIQLDSKNQHFMFSLFDILDVKGYFEAVLDKDVVTFVYILNSIILDLLCFIKTLQKDVIFLDLNKADLNIVSDFNSKEEFLKIVSLIKSNFTWIEDLRFSSQPIFVENLDSLGFNALEIKVNNNWFSLNQLGAGIKRYFLFLINMHMQVGNFYLDPALVFIEEPENHLHPDLQIEFVKFIISYFKKGNSSVVIETHSTVIIRTFQYLVLTNEIKSDDLGVFDFYSDLHRNTNIQSIVIDDGGFLSHPFTTGFDEEISKINFRLFEERNRKNQLN